MGPDGGQTTQAGRAVGDIFPANQDLPAIAGGMPGQNVCQAGEVLMLGADSQQSHALAFFHTQAEAGERREESEIVKG
ncbi:hypothetical protein AA14337_1501 [Acetobacter malorum DSM 14337]|uniref:Uncharacterized protein n=1 Tax=Acetobacter malorum DSM 14337 TaxID=1307910 RepID=A0ABQ0PT08_9PROT|nr:hypothetical protein AA14337_1501 [Acetobacter malorum DSM 14337]